MSNQKILNIQNNKKINLYNKNHMINKIMKYIKDKKMM